MYLYGKHHSSLDVPTAIVNGVLWAIFQGSGEDITDVAGLCAGGQANSKLYCL